MKPAFLILLLSCCVAHFSGSAQDRQELYRNNNSFGVDTSMKYAYSVPRLKTNDVEYLNSMAKKITTVESDVFKFWATDTTDVRLKYPQSISLTNKPNFGAYIEILNEEYRKQPDYFSQRHQYTLEPEIISMQKWAGINGNNVVIDTDELTTYKTTDLSFKEDLSDSCFKVIESLAFNYGMRTTIAEYKLLCTRLSDNGKFVVTLYNDWAKEGRPNLIPTDTICIYRGIIHYKEKTYKVGSIK